MKDSYLRSRVELKPLNSSDFKNKSKVIDYEQYQQQLENYNSDNKHRDITDLFDWSKPSQIVRPSLPAEQPEVLYNQSFNTEELLRSEPEDQAERQSLHESELDSSMEVESPIRPHHSPSPSYVQQIRSDYGSEYRLMSVIKLESQLKEMRERIIEMNARLNKMLDKYELLAGPVPKKEVQLANPHRFMAKEIELNNRIIEKQLEQIKQIDEKDKQLQKKDYLVELNELIIEIQKQIHDLEKQKHSQFVDVEKIDKLLKEFENVQQNGDQFKEVKELRHLIVFYFKKLKEQKTTEQTLERDHQMLAAKEQAISDRLTELSRIAEERCLEVSTNRHYVEAKKKYDELALLAESQRRKRDTTAKIQKGAEQKLEKEIQQLRKQIQKVEEEIQETEYRSQGVDQETQEVMNQNNLLTRNLKSISYRFDQSLIHPEKANFKPDFRRRAVTRMEGKVNKTIDVGSRDQYHPLEHINDNNVVPREFTESFENEENGTSSAASRMKPILRSWKGKGNSPRYIPSPQKTGSIQNSNIFKPSLLSRSRK